MYIVFGILAIHFLLNVCVVFLGTSGAVQSQGCRLTTEPPGTDNHRDRDVSGKSQWKSNVLISNI